MNSTDAIPAGQFRSRPRFLRIVNLVGGILSSSCLLFLLFPRSLNFPRGEYFNYLVLALIEIAALISIPYFFYSIAKTPTLRINQEGLYLKAKGRTYSGTWDDIEKLTVVTMQIRGKIVLYTGQKLLIISQGSHIGTINSFEIGNFEELINYLTEIKPATNKFFTPFQFQEKTFSFYLYTTVFWIFILLMINAIFLSDYSEYYLFGQ